jgi:Zn-dependent peptidase ImmA (M78 family)
VRAADGARARFSLAHEIGHAVLHWDRFDAPEGPDAEREAHRFAAALLMPAAEIRAMFARARLTLDAVEGLDPGTGDTCLRSRPA